jgi:hypothetical protein
MESNDYLLFERVRIMDNHGFTQPVEAYSLLLPKDWKYQGEIIWIIPGQPGAGNNMWFSAASPDEKFFLNFLPDLILNWNTNPERQQFDMFNAGRAPFTGISQPVDAEHFLRGAFVQELGNPQIVKLEPNNQVVQTMQPMLEKSRMELMQYGAAGVQHYPSAVNAEVKWSDGSEGFVLVCSVVGELLIQNMYTGGYDKTFTTMITRRTVFRYPATEKEKATMLFSSIMASMRSNDAHAKALNDFWKQVRQQSNQTHWDKIRMMDEQTRQMGENAVKQEAQRLKDMDNQVRNWEAKQTTPGDKMHTDFIKAIREVENFADETGTYEVAAGHDYVWSRGDGSSFVFSNNPNFDAAAVFNDQSWKKMKKVD